MTVITTTDKIVGLLKNKNAMMNKPTAAIAYTYNLRQGHLNLTHPFFCSGVHKGTVSLMEEWALAGGRYSTKFYAGRLR